MKPHPHELTTPQRPCLLTPAPWVRTWAEGPVWGRDTNAQTITRGNIVVEIVTVKRCPKFPLAVESVWSLCETYDQLHNLTQPPPVVCTNPVAEHVSVPL